MADMRNRTPFYGAVPTSKLQADHVFMADGSTLQEQADKKFELIEDITTTENVSIVTFSDLNLKEIAIEVIAPIDTTVKSILCIITDDNNEDIIRSSTSNFTSTTNERHIIWGIFNLNGLYLYFKSGPQNTSISSGASTSNAGFINSIINTASVSYSNILAGTRIKLYGVKA